MYVGQFLNRVNVRISRLAEGQRSAKQILELSDEKALDAGATFLGEVFIFSVGAVVITQEIVRSNRKSWAVELQKEEEARAKELQLNSQYFESSRRIQLLEEGLNETQAVLNVLLARTAPVIQDEPVMQSTSSLLKTEERYELERLLKSSLSSVDSI